MSEVHQICQKWRDRAKPNVVAVFPKEGFQCGLVRRSDSLTLSECAPPSFVITWFLRGKGTYTVGGIEHPIFDGCVLLRRPGRGWKLWLDGSAPTMRYYLQMPQCVYETITLFVPELESSDCVFSKEYDDSTERQFQALVERLTSSGTSRLWQEFPAMTELMKGLLSRSESSVQRSLSAGKALLEELHSELTLEEIAEACGMRYGTFRKGFAQAYAVSPGQYRIQYRVSCAQKLLSEGMRVGDVAESLGYPDIYTFSHQFRLVTGSTPRQIQKQK